MTNSKHVRVIMPDRINGSRRTTRGVYVPTADTIRKTLAGMVPDPKKLAPYIPQGNELKVMEVARKNQKAVLLSGPTGIGKTHLAHTYAANNGLPLLLYPASDDTTDWSLRGSFGMVMAPLEIDGAMHDAKFQAFSPAQLALGAMTPVPVVLFIDELHKMRPGASAILHGVTNPTERTLYCYDICGENYPLHPDTLVLAAVNPAYGEGGIERLDPALRRRFATINLQMPNQATMKKIVKANVPGLDAKTEELVGHLIALQAGISVAARGNEEGGVAATMMATSMDVTALDTETTSSIIEVPSPASIVDTVKDVIAGLPVMDAIEVNMINTIVADFTGTARALMEYVKANIPESVRQ